MRPPCMSCGGDTWREPPEACLDKKNHVGHNHDTRNIQPQGECPGCDLYHEEAAERRQRFEDQGRLIPGITPRKVQPCLICGEHGTHRFETLNGPRGWLCEEHKDDPVGDHGHTERRSHDEE